ncbi:MAG: hypothetical protein EOL87_14590 [Spartobacteria bacterium]|nr:hypothetical protein [Spartobacteria bacterium]
MLLMIKTGGRGCGGFVLPVVVALTAAMGIVAASLVYMNQQAIHTAQHWQDSDECMLAAQSAIEQAKYEIFSTFSSFFRTKAQQNSAFNWFDTVDETGQLIGINWMGTDYSCDLSTLQSVSVYPSCSVTVKVLRVESGITGIYPFRRLVLQGVGRRDGVVRAVEEHVEYGLETSRIFNYAYFINNFGWFYGVNVIMNGDIRSNYDMDFRSDPFRLNGQPYVANRSVGNYNSWDRNDYLTSVNGSKARPMDPPDFSNASITHWPMGYDPAKTAVTNAGQLEMPYLGDLSSYTNYAAITGGTLMLGTNVVVSQFCTTNTPGPSGVTNGYDSGCIAIIGTAANPIVISGAVVVARDVIIGGYYKGQGTIYAGRNVHIVDDLERIANPEWSKPDSNPYATAAGNADKDLLGLAAKGNIIVGNYTSSSWLTSTMIKYTTPNFTSPYIVDESDASIGYCTSVDSDSNYWFHANYTAKDGGYQQGDTAGSPSRRFFESSLSDSDFIKYAGTGLYKPARVDAVLYNNHLMAGYFGNNAEFNGCVVARDECIIPNGLMYFNWDIRLGDMAHDSIDTYFYLPTSLAPCQTVGWREVLLP